ncbi:MAG: RIP metalloprotease RseP [Candidatus Puniceispirillaceae bacterium]
MGQFGVIIDIVALLAMLTPIVFIHEFGHYYIARRNNVAVDVFSVGFGPELYHWTDKHGTRWRIAALPLGGYVKMRGDENAASMTSEASRAIKGSFASASLGARMAIVAAGPVANFITGILLFAIIYMTVGKAVMAPVVGQVLPDSPALEAGLQEGDVIKAVNDITVSDFSSLRGLVSENPNKELSFTLERDGDLIDVLVVPEERCSEELRLTYGFLGVQSLQGEMRKLGFGESIMQGVKDTIAFSQAMLRGITRMVTGNMNRGEIGGPVKIAKISGDAARAGWVAFLFWGAVISLNLGLVNLLPIPALDGGHLMLFSIEALLRRPLSDKLQSALLRGGSAFLMSAMVMLIFYDSYSALIPQFCP